MRAPTSSLVTIASLASLLAFAGCSGGGTSPVAAPQATSPGPGPSAGSATLNFVIPLPGGSNISAKRSRKPQYVGISTQSITIVITGGPSGTTSYPTVTAKKQCVGSTCSFDATTSLPVQSFPYTFAFTAQGLHGTLSQGSVSQTLVRGANVVDVTLAPIVASAHIAVKGTPNPAVSTAQTLPITVTPLDADGNTITGTDAFAQPFPVTVFEVDNQGLYGIAKAGGSPTCSQATCLLNSSADTIELTYSNSVAVAAGVASYYPSEAILLGSTAASAVSYTFTKTNSADVTTAPCVTPAPICVYAQPYYPLLLAGTAPGTTAVIFPAYFITVAGSTIWTDAGIIGLAGSVPTYTNNKVATNSQVLGGLALAPSDTSAFSVDYNSSFGGGVPQLIDSISNTGRVSMFSYAADLNGTTTPQGGGVILGPDGNLWWIDPVTASLRYASPATPAKASVCPLAPSSANEVLSAAQIVGTPPGVTPARIWFSAIDNVADGEYVGYITAATCGNATYTEIDGTDTSGYPPNGLAVDENGNAWYNDGLNLTDVGEVIVNGSGALSAPATVTLPGGFQNGGQAWGMLLDLSDKQLYFASDNGLIGRFSASAGPAHATAYAVPGPIANTADILAGNDYGSSDTSCGNTLSATNISGPCFPQLTWDAGSGGAGRLSLIIPNIESTFSSTPNTESVIASIALSDPAITFSPAARTHRSSAYHYGHPRHSGAPRRHRIGRR